MEIWRKEDWNVCWNFSFHLFGPLLILKCKFQAYLVSKFCFPLMFYFEDIRYSEAQGKSSNCQSNLLCQQSECNFSNFTVLHSMFERVFTSKRFSNSLSKRSLLFKHRKYVGARTTLPADFQVATEFTKFQNSFSLLSLCWLHIPSFFGTFCCCVCVCGWTYS